MDKYRLDGHKLFWHQDRVAKWLSGETIAPVYVEISPVDICSHKCVFCGIDFARKNKNILDTKILKTRISEMAAAGVKSLMFAGDGEPLLHRDLPEIIKHAKDAGLDSGLTTNGSPAAPPEWDTLLPSLQWVKFSADAGDDKTYSLVHGVPAGTFAKTARTIGEAVRIKKEKSLPVTLGVQFLALPENIDSLEKAIEVFTELKLDYFVIKPFSKHPRMSREVAEGYSADKKLIDRIKTVIEKTAASGLNVIFREETMSEYIKGGKHFSRCRALSFWGYIAADGDFHTCSNLRGDKNFLAGNIYESGMKEIFFGEKRKRSIAYGEKELCAQEECRTNCRMAKINEYLEFLAKPPEHINFI